jgi:hypothetical protein
MDKYTYEPDHGRIFKMAGHKMTWPEAKKWAEEAAGLGYTRGMRLPQPYEVGMLMRTGKFITVRPDETDSIWTAVECGGDAVAVAQPTNYRTVINQAYIPKDGRLIALAMPIFTEEAREVKLKDSADHTHLCLQEEHAPLGKQGEVSTIVITSVPYFFTDSDVVRLANTCFFLRAGCFAYNFSALT